MPAAAQVAQVEDEVAAQKRAMDADLREKVAEAERLRAAVEELRNATSHDVAASEAGILGLQVRRGLGPLAPYCVFTAVSPQAAVLPDEGGAAQCHRP